ncbi:uncharacterized protein E0L32_010268 [Thyridium curvatum]|uniref:CHK kinase-like domain-containing protein n=1 Tax=Thyridium curvatum TaxID=1093900 RepID=A0A507AT72_9PEZI|nr:uncharacterized protein E0L32_010268 [Thyridium curvatum]TPX08068.1 hypothetical protein E0L32_010268 [Thyridium curvatum]
MLTPPGDDEATGSHAPIPAIPNMSTLPSVAAELTPGWLSTVLNRNVKSADLVGFWPGTASKAFLSVVFDDDSASRPVRLCVKGGFQPEFLRQQPFLVSLFQREVDFYNRIAPTLDHMGLPPVHWAGHTAEQGIIIFDDLAAHGCTFVPPTETWPADRVLAGVEQLAALHAKTWGVQPADYPWLTSDYDQIILTLLETYDQVVNGPDRPDIPAALRNQARVTAAVRKHFAMRNPRFQCLLHGDPHVANAYLENGAPRFLDWQTVHIGSAFHDVAYFVAGALSIEDRRTHEWDILAHYLRTLQRLGGPSLSPMDQEVVFEYKKSLLAGIGWIMCPYSMQAKENVMALAVRYAAALDDSKVLDLVERLARSSMGA